MSSHHEPVDTVLFDELGVMVTDTQVRTGKKVYPLSGSAFSRIRSSEGIEVDREATARLRRRILPWGLAVALVACAAAAWGFADAVQAQYYLNEGREVSVWVGRSVAFGIAAIVAALALVGTLLCARVQRKYRLYHVFLDTRAGRREITRSSNEARVRAIAAAMDKAIARLSVASTESPIPSSSSPHGETASSLATS